ncbi:MAG: MBOAT family protein [Clostridia bacterium]|nr:MBOAT family protein [Clostridia bacterium]
MIFSSITFLLLMMPLTLLGYRAMPSRARLPFLFCASLFFYGWGNPLWLLLLGFSLLLNYFGALLMVRGEKKRRSVLALLIALNLLPLLIFKYAGLFRDTWNQLTGLSWNFPTPPLPAGISFFTFQAMSYLLDVWRGESRVQRQFLVFGVYLSLFPQLVAGPIVRYTDLEEQLLRHPRPAWSEMRSGLFRFSVGLAKKVLLADSMGRFWGQVNRDFSSAGTLGAWLGLLAFSFQIFFDFSGYSDMALGLGECLGFRFPENFRRPYMARSLTDFWRRWHMTLTGWFREYVYFPLGGSRRGRVRRDLNVLIVWALTGLWHGAGWHFVLWGLYFAFLLILEKRFLLGHAFYERIPGILRQAGTFFLVFLGWGLFSGFGRPLFEALLGLYGAASPEAKLLCISYVPMLLICGLFSFVPLPDRLRVKPGLSTAVCLLLLLLSLAAITAEGYAPFVYFQF